MGSQPPRPGVVAHPPNFSPLPAAVPPIVLDYRRYRGRPHTVVTSAATYRRTDEGEHMSVEVVDAVEEKRYEARIDGELAGFAAYIPADGMRVITHTEVDPAHEGKGVGSALTKFALDDLRTRGEKVMPICPFVVAYLQRHPEYADLAFNAPASRVQD